MEKICPRVSGEKIGISASGFTFVVIKNSHIMTMSVPVMLMILLLLLDYF